MLASSKRLSKHTYQLPTNWAVISSRLGIEELPVWPATLFTALIIQFCYLPSFLAPNRQGSKLSIMANFSPPAAYDPNTCRPTTALQNDSLCCDMLPLSCLGMPG